MKQADFRTVQLSPSEFQQGVKLFLAKGSIISLLDALHVLGYFGCRSIYRKYRKPDNWS